MNESNTKINIIKSLAGSKWGQQKELLVLTGSKPSSQNCNWITSHGAFRTLPQGNKVLPVNNQATLLT